ncbi:MAG: PilZ domain-containing protein [Candidatus Sulfotelmatobacter sp.]
MERRNSPRYSVSVEIEVKEIASRTPSRGHTTDVSLTGCYVATIFPLSIGTEVDLKMWMDECNIKGRGSVQTCHSGVGMGIKFTNLTRDTIRQLNDYLRGASAISSGESLQPFIR